MAKKKQEIDILSLLKSEIEKTQEKIKEYKELSKPIAPENAIGADPDPRLDPGSPRARR